MGVALASCQCSEYRTQARTGKMPVPHIENYPLHIAVFTKPAPGVLGRLVKRARLEAQLGRGSRHELEESEGAHPALRPGIEARLVKHLRGDGEVIVPTLTWVSDIASVLQNGFTPVFVDIEPDTYVIDAARIEAAITPRTRAICPVHLFGLPADMDMIRAIADRHGLAVVEDACQAHGAEFRGRKVGSFGHGAFSLYGTKNMTTGEGGLITTDDDRLADWIRLYRNQGMRQRYHHEILGYNFRLTDIASAIGLCQLDKLERNTQRRRAIAARYDAAFADLPVKTPITPVGRTHVFHQYTVDVGPERDAIRHRAPFLAPGAVGIALARARLVQQCGDHGGIHATGEAEQHLLRADLRAHALAGARSGQSRHVADIVSRADLFRGKCDATIQGLCAGLGRQIQIGEAYGDRRHAVGGRYLERDAYLHSHGYSSGRHLPIGRYQRSVCLFQIGRRQG